MCSFLKRIFCCCNCFKSSDKRIEKNESLAEIPDNTDIINEVIDRQIVPINENRVIRNKCEINDEMINKKVKKVIIEPNSHQTSIILTNNGNGSQQTEQLLIDEQTLKEELSRPIKFDALSYGRVRTNQRLLSDEQYNELGLIDVKSHEFSSVKEFMDLIDMDLTETIGSGNYGEVYKVEDRNNKTQLCVKVINLIEVNNKYQTQFISRDVSLIKELSHKNIIRVYRMIRTPNKIYQVMEWSKKGSLADWIALRGPLSELMARLLFIPIVEGLDHLHSKNIAHRNLKLENILLSENLNPKLSDFCYAIIVNRKRPKSRTICGSLPYLSPEILQYLPYNPMISDIWSLGVCLYIMINDRLPFNSNVIKEILEKQLMNNWRFRRSVDSNTSEELKLLIGSMLETDVGHRPDTKQLFASDWIIRQQTNEQFSVRSELN